MPPYSVPTVICASPPSLSAACGRRRSGGRTDASTATPYSMSGGYTPSVHLFSQSRGKLRWDEALQAFVPSVSAERERSAGACRGVYELADVLADGAAAGAAAAPRPAVDAAPLRRRSASSAASRAYLGALPQARFAEPRQILRRLAARCDHARSGARHPRGLSVHRTRQALYHHGHGDGSGQDLESQRHGHRRQEPREGRPASGAHHLSHALHAGDLRQLRRHFARRFVRSGARHADSRLGAGARRGIRECGAVEARALFSARRRGHACRGGARMPRGAQRLRHFRCLHARQDRGRRRRRRGIHEPAVHQQLEQPRGRPLALRNTAARRRLHLRRRRGGAYRAPIAST